MRKVIILLAVLGVLLAVVGIGSGTASAQTAGTFSVSSTGLFNVSKPIISSLPWGFNFQVPVTFTATGSAPVKGTLDVQGEYTPGSATSNAFTIDFKPTGGSYTQLGKGTGTFSYSTSGTPTFSLSGMVGTDKFSFTGELQNQWGTSQHGTDIILTPNGSGGISPAPEVGSVVGFAVMLIMCLGLVAFNANLKNERFVRNSI